MSPPLMADLFTNVRPGRAHRRPSPAGLVHDGASWVAADQAGGPLSRLAASPIRSAVPEGFDPARPDDWREYVGADELEDGIGGYLRVVPQSARDQELDDLYLLAGEPLYRSVDDRFEVEPLEDEGQAERRRRLLERLREHELDPAWR